jgi:hypothetical protein
MEPPEVAGMGGAITGVISGSSVLVWLVSRRQKGFFRVAALKSNLDHIANMKPDARGKEGNNVLGTLTVRRQERSRGLATAAHCPRGRGKNNKEGTKEEPTRGE